MSGILELAKSMKAESENILSDSNKRIENEVKRQEALILKVVESNGQNLRNAILNENQSNIKRLKLMIKIINWKYVTPVLFLILFIPLSLLYLDWMVTTSEENRLMYKNSLENLKKSPIVKSYGVTEEKQKFIWLKKGNYLLQTQKDGTAVLFQED